MEKKLLKLLLSHVFYTSNKHRLVKEMFPGDFELLWDTIVTAHETYERDLTVPEVRQLVRVQNPLMTQANMRALQEVLIDVENEPNDMGEDVASDVLKYMWKTEIGRRIAQCGMDIVDGKCDNLHEVSRVIESTREDFLPADELQPVTTDVDSILEQLDARTKWTFNIDTLAAYVPGISGGDLTTVFARPETGKTGFWVSTVFGPKGFLEQGASVHAIINEEPAIRTMSRGLSCATGIPIDKFKENKQKLRELFEPIRKNAHLVDSVGMTMEWLDLYCRDKKPDILILDQIDKFGISGTFARPDERLKQIYVYGREIAKRHNTALIAVCQASADAEGKTILHYSMMENSKTGKGAECDLIIGIGKLPQNDNNPVDNRMRYLTLSKNKITGRQGTALCTLNNTIHRYEA